MIYSKHLLQQGESKYTDMFKVIVGEQWLLHVKALCAVVTVQLLTKYLHYEYSEHKINIWPKIVSPNDDGRHCIITNHLKTFGY